MLQDLQELQQQLLEAAKDKKEVTSHDLGRKWLQKVMQMVVYYKYHIWSGMVWYGMHIISIHTIQCPELLQHFLGRHDILVSILL